MKKLYIVALLLCICSFLTAQPLQVTQNSFEKVEILFTTDSLYVEDVSVPEGNFSLVSMQGYDVSNNPGAPQLPLLAKLLQIPVCDSVVVTIVNAEYMEYDASELGIAHPLFPSQPSVSKSSVNPPFVYDPVVYSTDTFYALPLVSVEKAGVRRDIALANVYVSPIQYNPVTKRIRIYTHIDVEFTFAKINMDATQRLDQYASPMFSIDNSLVLNPMDNDAKDEYKGIPIKYLIIANSMFSSNADLTSFVEWKRRLGYKVELAFTSDANVGTTTTSIKNFIQNKYNNATTADPAPTFLLLIGDVAQLPAFTGQSNSGHVTDLHYATLAGNDNLPDCYYGRMSATSNAELSNQIVKILMYEQYTMPDPSYLGNAVLIAGTDDNGYSPTHADGQINYIYNNYINTNSTTHNFTTVYKHNYNCSSQAATIRSEINAGVSIANYTAHGSYQGWADPAFTTSHVPSMTNAGKYGLLIGNCCVSGKFDESVCFGESLLRAANKGAMGYIGASNNSYWNEDVYWAVGVRSSINANMSYDASKLGAYDKWFHTHNEAYSNWVSTIGGILQGGNMSVQSSSSSRKLYYWEIYHCFGDPSVRVYMGIPSAMTVTANSDIPVSSSSYTVQAVPYAYVALKKNTTEYVAAAFANANGTATLTFSTSLETGSYELVVLAQNRIPYFQDINVVDDGACATPNNLAVSNITPFTATVSWTGSADSYNIQRKTNSSNWTNVATNVTATTYTLTGLQDNTDYQVRVQSVCVGETSYWKTANFTTPVACPVPTDFACTAFTTTTATLSWTENGSANSWTLQYGTNSNFASGTYTEVTMNGNPSITLTGLTTETIYYARVRAICGSIYGNSQWSDVCTFKPSNQIIKCEDFEAYTGTAYNVAGVLPVGWNAIFSGTNSAYSPHVATVIYNSAVISSGNGLCFTSGSTSYGTDNYAILPSYDGTLESITFEYRYESTSYGTLYFGYITDISNASTFVSLQTVPANTTQGTSVTYSLSASNIPEGARLAFKWHHTSSYYTCGIDNVCVTVNMPANDCVSPESLVAEPSSTSAVVSWTGEADSYNVRYRTVGTDVTYFFDDFENGIDNWTVIRSGGGTTSTDWHQFDPHNFSSGGFDAYSGTYVVIGRSWASSAYNVDNWLITPTVTLDGILKFWVKDDGSYHEHYDIYVSTGGNATSDFTLLYSPGNASSTWTEVSVDLSAYHGATGYIALRLTDEDQDYLMIDDFGIYSNGSSTGEWQTLVTNNSTATITGLSPATEYEVEVQAVCGEDGVSVWTNSVNFTTTDNSIIPTYVNISGTNGVCPGATTTLTASSDVEGTYSWSTGATGAQITVGAGSYTVTITSSTGNQLSESVTITSFPTYNTPINATICDGNGYNFYGQNLTTAGEYTHTLQTVHGCDSVITLTLTVNNPTHTAVTESACGSYTWNGTEYTTSGEYTFSHLDDNGCTQVDTLHLTINNPTHTAVTESACGSYTWNGTEYTTSGEYTFSHLDDNGCTQVDTLHLTINNPVHTAVTESACGSYTWNGTEYTTSGEYTYSHQDDNGCTQV
ncbi:MAG: choice-of-anchor J domain-containing protein, partial [Bacteroidales bacterium]|nr:choice-of-anchor J domain-containing protein [Bacteroidales bacterium]